MEWRALTCFLGHGDCMIWNQYSSTPRKVEKQCGQSSTKHGLSCHKITVSCQLLTQYCGSFSDEVPPPYCSYCAQHIGHCPALTSSVSLRIVQAAKASFVSWKSSSHPDNISFTWLCHPFVVSDSSWLKRSRFTFLTKWT